VFTGIVLDVGRIEAIERMDDGAKMRFATHLETSGWALGDSVAVDGCCLTLVEIAASSFSAILSLETLAKTRFSAVRVGDAVNLEPALRLGDALGGHLVSGHVDGVGKVESVEAVGEHRRYRFSVPDGFARYLVVKGSVTVNGVSLTVNAVEDCSFEVNLIPHTLAHTNLGRLAANDAVNIETDMIGRYVERLLGFGQHAAPQTNNSESFNG